MIELDIIPGLLSQPIASHLFPGFQGKDPGAIVGIGLVNLPVNVFPFRSAEDTF
jgi:hypothetical protein